MQTTKKYSCAYCGKAFPKPCLLSRHEAGHLPQKPYECADCSKRFTQKSSLQRHRQHHHEGKKQYECSKCAASFAQKANLLTHIRRTHPQNASKDKHFPCLQCSCVFSKANILSRHILKRHAIQQALLPKFNEAHEEEEEASMDWDPKALVANALAGLEYLQRDMNLQANRHENLPQPQSSSPTVQSANELVVHYDFSQLFSAKVDEVEASQSFNCPHCEKSFSNQFKLNRHVRRHILDEKSGLFSKQHTCSICQQHYNSLRQLDRHMRIHANTHNLRYVCANCPRTFKSKTAFAMHRHTHADEDLRMLQKLLPVPLDLNETDATRSLKTAAYEKRLFECTICGWKCQKSSHLKQHLAHHEMLRKYKCASCSRFYATKSALNVHQKTHMAHFKHSYACLECGDKRFTTKGALRRHALLKHSLSKNYKCVYCAETFKTKYYCQRHMSTHLKRLLNVEQADEVQPLVGHVEVAEIATASVVPNNPSNAKFIELQMLPSCKRHRHHNFIIKPLNKTETAANEPVIGVINEVTLNACQFCTKLFKKPSDLKRHILTHTRERAFNCDVCHKTYSLKSTLNEHRRTHEEKRVTHACQVCGKQYASKKVLVVHLRLHTGERPFKCELCEQTFRTSGHRIAHVRAKHKQEDAIAAPS